MDPRSRYSAELAAAILARVESGEALLTICREAGMPTHGTVGHWARTIPKFARALALAKEAGGWSAAGQPPRGYDARLARVIFARMCAGETMTRICADPTMPGYSTVYRWRDQQPAFRAMLGRARAVQAEMACDRGLDIVDEVEPGNAYACKVKLEQLRWTAGTLAPERFGRHRAVEAEVLTPPPEPPAIMIRHFTMEEREEDGAIRVVGWSRDPETNQPVRVTPLDAPWTTPPGHWLKNSEPMWRSYAAREKLAYVEARSRGETPERAAEIGEAAAVAGMAADRAAVAGRAAMAGRDRAREDDPEGWL